MIGWGHTFRVSGLGSRVPGSGVQVRVQVQDLNFTPHPYLNLITRTRDLRAETWDPKMNRFVNRLTGQLTLPLYAKRRRAASRSSGVSIAMG